MTEKKLSQPVGTTWDLGKGKHSVTRPDGVEVAVTGGLYVLTQVGTHTSGDKRMEAK